MSEFQDKVIKVVKSIPKGETLSYSDVARLAGSPGAARAVGTIMSHNQDNSVPCHRVIKANGEPGGYNNLRSQSKSKLLNSEQSKIASRSKKPE